MRYFGHDLERGALLGVSPVWLKRDMMNGAKLQ
jgi:hypothetical protein